MKRGSGGGNGGSVCSVTHALACQWILQKYSKESFEYTPCVLGGPYCCDGALAATLARLQYVPRANALREQRARRVAAVIKVNICSYMYDMPDRRHAGGTPMRAILFSVSRLRLLVLACTSQHHGSIECLVLCLSLLTAAMYLGRHSWCLHACSQQVAAALHIAAALPPIPTT